MTNQILKETIADYGLEEAVSTVIELIKEGYLLEFYSFHQINLFRLQLEAALLIRLMDDETDKEFIGFDCKKVVEVN